MKITLKCDFNDLQFSRVDNKAIVSFKLHKNDMKLFDTLHELQEKSKNGLRVEVDTWREKRSLDANAYFHVLVHEIARVMNISDSECKIRMNLEYGTIGTDKKGNKAIIKLPKSVDIRNFYDYAKWIRDDVVDRFEVSYYVLYKQTHKLDSKEMARLIDGIVSEAKELGIETRTPNEIAQMKASWGSEQ